MMKAVKLNRESLSKILTDYFDSRALSDIDVEDIIDYHKFDDETLIELALGVVGLVYGTSGRKIIDILDVFDRLEESEETEVKKDIEWLKRSIGDIIDYHYEYPLINGRTQGMINEIKKVMEQADEPELLTQEWIDEKKVFFGQETDETDFSRPVYGVEEGDLLDLLVPKQEEVTEEAHEKYGMSETRWKEVIERYKWHLEQEGYAVIERPIIPQFVADWLEAYRDGWELYISIEEAINYERFDGRTKESDAQSEEMQHWLLNADNQELYARAWLVGYTVEDKKYYVLDAEDIPLLERANNQTCKTTTALSIHEDGRDNSKFELTEQEIKDYDPRYWAFAKPVEEEER